VGEQGAGTPRDTSPSRGEGSLREPGPRPPGPGPSGEPPPFGRRWGTLYALVVGTLVALIVLFYAFTKAFE
jgi:hypothetical protein